MLMTDCLAHADIARVFLDASGAVLSGPLSRRPWVPGRASGEEYAHGDDKKGMATHSAKMAHSHNWVNGRWRLHRAGPGAAVAADFGAIDRGQTQEPQGR